MKVLFISFIGSSTYSGGKQCSMRNLSSLGIIYGKSNVITYIFKPYQSRNILYNIVFRLLNILRFYMGGVTKKDERDIIDVIETNSIDIVFIDSSLLGIIAKKIKKLCPHVKIVTFFHNLEYKFCRDHVLVKKDYIRFYWIILSYINEKKAVKYSDRIICLNERDFKGITGKYARKPDSIIPISLQDNFMEEEKEIQPYIVLSDRKKALFIGSYFFANVEGIKWFIANVLPEVNVDLVIVGAGMDNLKKDIKKIPDNVLIYNDVPDLSPYYMKADFVVLPIFSGSGMKVKTAESLMYGKFIIGTTEAFVGYEVNREYTICCNSPEEFILAINNLNTPKYLDGVRALFLKKYSFEATLNLFKGVLF